MTFRALNFTFVFILVLATACSTMVSKSTYPVRIYSQPTEAEISVVDRNGKTVYEGKTPKVLDLKASAGDYIVTFKKQGYATYSGKLKRSFDEWYVGGNFILGGLIGWLIVDPVTGAMWKLQDELIVTLSPHTSSSFHNNQLCIITLDAVPVHLCSKLVRIN